MSDNCPKCDTSFIGVHEGITYRREIGIDGFMLGLYDGIMGYVCPDCKHEFPIGDHPLYIDMFNQYQEYKNAKERAGSTEGTI